LGCSRNPKAQFITLFHRCWLHWSCSDQGEVVVECSKTGVCASVVASLSQTRKSHSAWQPDPLPASLDCICALRGIEGALMSK
jgi:hypothetical protein